MSKEKKNYRVIYSTNPDFQYEETEQEKETPVPSSQKLTIRLDRKQRKGKKVTLISGFQGTAEDLKALASTLKSKCGVGGSAKADEIIIQGDFRDKVRQILSELGYPCKVSG
jgi:translation initiation factor 1